MNYRQGCNQENRGDAQAQDHRLPPKVDHCRDQTCPDQGHSSYAVSESVTKGSVDQQRPHGTSSEDKDIEDGHPRVFRRSMLRIDSHDSHLEPETGSRGAILQDAGAKIR